MPNETVERLLAAVDPLPYPQRVAEVACKAMEFAAADRLPALLDGLTRHGLYGERLAALAASAGRQTDYLAARLTHPDRVIRGYALRAARTLPLPDEAIEAAYLEAPAAVRRLLARAVGASRRTGLAERLVPVVRAHWGAAEAARLLPSCSAEFAARLLPELAHAVNSWSALAKRHPDAVLDHGERALAQLPPEQRTGWWASHGEGVVGTAAVRPERVLTLLEAYGPRSTSRALLSVLGALAAADAERTARWLADPGRPNHGYEPIPSPSVLRRLVQADPPSLPSLGRRWLQRPQHFAALLKALPPSRRDAFLTAAAAGVELGAEHLTDPVLHLLPRERRFTEARRLHRRAQQDGRPWPEVARRLAQLPAAEAGPELLAATRRPDAEDRALAWSLLIANAGRSADPVVVLEVVTTALRLRNEQDPVRAAALESLALLPARLIGGSATEALRQIVLDALQARDSSHRTRQSLRLLAVSVLREYADGREPSLLDWAMHSLERIAGHTGAADLGLLNCALRRGQEHQVYQALRPWLEKAADTADYGLLFAFTRALGRRAERMPEIQELLWHALQFGDDHAFSTAAEYWLADSASRAGRVAELLALEPSAAVLRPVTDELTYRRTDLLDRLLDPEPPYGRFLKPGTRRPLPPFHDADRWVPRQQDAAARLATAAAADPNLPLYDRAWAIRTAAAIPGHGSALALSYADDPEVVLAEAALAALPWTDRPAETLPVLLAHVGDDRARVAVYSASRTARYAPPSQLESDLGELLTRPKGVKVTARKEAVRLAAQHLPAGQAARLLALAYRAEGQHRDVQAAVVAFATELLDHEEIWAVLALAAGSDEPQVRRAVLRTRPVFLPAAHRIRYAALVAEVSRSTDPEVAGPALKALPDWARYAPDSLEVLRRVAGDLTGRATWREAVQTVRRISVSGLPHPLGGAEPGSLAYRTVADLLAAVRAGEADAEAERDLPARQRLTELTGLTGGRDSDGVLTAFAAQLAEEPSLLPLRAQLLARTVHLDGETDELLGRMRALAEVLHGRPGLAMATADRLRATMGGTPSSPAVPLAAARSLAADGDPAHGLLANALLAALGPRLGWPEEWRGALRVLRRHPAPEVRDAAHAVLTAHE